MEEEAKMPNDREFFILKTVYSYAKTQTFKEWVNIHDILFLKGKIEHYMYSRVGIETKDIFVIFNVSDQKYLSKLGWHKSNRGPMQQWITRACKLQCISFWVFMD